MKLYKFENTGCPACDRAKLFIKGIEADKLVESKMPYLKDEDAILAGRLEVPLMSFPTFIVFDKEGNEVLGKRMNGFDSNRVNELMDLIDFVQQNQ